MSPKLMVIILLAAFSLVKIFGISKYTKLLVEQTKKNEVAKKAQENQVGELNNEQKNKND